MSSRYGKGFDWSAGGVVGAANLLLRYLKTLPEPIIPYDFYNRFRTIENLIDRPLGIPLNDLHPALTAAQQLVRELPAFHRTLLLYMLDILAVFASYSHNNEMPASRLVAAFQPSLLCGKAEEMDSREHQIAHGIMVFMVENQDHFLFGA